MQTSCIYNDHAEENSLEHVLVSEVYPLKQLVMDQTGLAVPFTPLCGECVEYLGRTSDGLIALSNYRLFIESFVNIPIGLIESVEYRDIFYLHIYSKDARTVRCTFLTNDVCLEWYKRLVVAVKPKTKLQDVFAFAFSAWYLDAIRDAIRRQDLPESMQIIAPSKTDDGHLYSFGREIQRLQFDTHKAWRIAYINENFNICPSYPKYHLVPNFVSDKDLENIAGFRSSRRFPTVVWRDLISGAVLARASQPEVGWFGWRNTQDENFLQSVATSCLNNPGLNAFQKQNNGDFYQKEMNGSIDSNGVSAASSKNVVIIDARSYTAAVANRAKGGGCECAEYYPNCEIMFMSLANIHTIRKSFLTLRSLCATSPELPGWLTNIENTKWLHHISGLLKASLVVVNTIDKEHRCVLVHCSDGWDRTPQIVALAELMLDPYYRTMEGFRILVEKEWLEFGHKFADRCGQGIPVDDANERCPVFLQWLDCVHQLLQQFPCSFQFNEAFLVKLVQHTYSCLFGDFLCNTEKERISERVYQQTLSVWKMLCLPGSPFVNLLYRPPSEKDRILRPRCQIQSLHFWSSVYLSEMSSSTVEDLVEMSESESTSSTEASPDNQMPAKTRSCENLSKEEDDGGMFPNPVQRRLSDPNLIRDFPPDLVLSEPDRLVPLLCEELMSNGDALLEQLAAAPMESNRVGEVNKCASVETLKAHEDDEHSADNGVFKAPEQHASVFLVNGKLVHDKTSFCDASDYNDGLGVGTDVGNIEAGAADCQQAPSTFEDSSETLTGDFSETSRALPARDTASVNAPVDASNQQNALHLKICDGLYKQDGAAGPMADDDEEEEEEENHASLNGSASAVAAKVMLEKCSSTTDLISWQSINRHHPDKRGVVANASDAAPPPLPHSAVTSGPQQKPVAGVLSVDTSRSSPPSQNSTCGMTFGTCREWDLTGSQAPSGCSSNPITPNSEVKYLSWGVKQSGRYPRNQEFDGLTVYVDPVQQRIAQMKFDYDVQIRQLTRQLIDTRLIMKQMAEQGGTHFAVDFNQDEAASSDSGGERGSMGGGSAVASDLSWEQVEEKDAQMTLWVPDHVATHCTGCDKEFWMALRKHHCRSCGHIFCDECSKYSIPVPQQQLLNPVRVCKKCFQAAKGDHAEQTVTEASRQAAGDSVPCYNK